MAAVDTNAPESETLTKDETKHEAKRRKKASKNPIISTQSVRHPPWSYIHLRRVAQTPVATSLDETTIILWLETALERFLGIHGRAISLDLMKLDGNDVWIRIQNADRSSFVAAVSGWVSRDESALRVLGHSSWDANGFDRSHGQSLFTD